MAKEGGGYSSEFYKRLDEKNRLERGSKEFINRYYLRELGLDWDFLRGKKILDLGADIAGFAKVAKDRGMDVVSLDLHDVTAYAGGESSNEPLEKKILFAEMREHCHSKIKPSMWLYLKRRRQLLVEFLTKKTRRE